MEEDYSDPAEDEHARLRSSTGGPTVRRSCCPCSCCGGALLLFPRGRGNMISVARLADGSELMVGPHVSMLMVTYAIIIALSVVIYGVVLTEREAPERIAGLVLTLLVIVVLSVLALKDPGVVPLSSEPRDEPSTFWDRCEGYRPIGAIHCNDCNVCIEEYDHHCPWSSKCIGKRNVMVFHTFLVLLFALMVRILSHDDDDDKYAINFFILSYDCRLSSNACLRFGMHLAQVFDGVETALVLSQSRR